MITLTAHQINTIFGAVNSHDDTFYIDKTNMGGGTTISVVQNGVKRFLVDANGVVFDFPITTKGN